ncbi:MAG: cell division protein FtsA [Candidatus Omnitrophica bacterium]|nr:cell division protein FtsA [Candidatus Omnitrophota bacterium]
MKNNYICALDIGTSKISAVLAEIKARRIWNIFFDTAEQKGVKRGVIVDPIELVNSITAILGRLKEKSGVPIKYLYTNISGADIVTKHSRAIIPLAERGNKVITRSDINKVDEQARILGSSLEEEIIHEIPSSYTIDSKCNIINPLGLYSHRLEVDLYLICGKLSSLQSLSRVINQAGYEIKDLFFSGIATSEIVFPHSDVLKRGINVLCDIGSDLTEIVVFEDGLLKDIKILPQGGMDLTLQLAQELKIPFDLAEDIKKTHGSVGDYSQIKEEKEILVKKNNLYRPIKQKTVSEILTQKANSLSQVLKGSLEEIVPLTRISNLVVVGRTIALDGFLEIMENNFTIPTKPGRINHPDITALTAHKEVFLRGKHLDYLTAMGMLCLALRKTQPQVLSDSPPAPNLLARTINKLKEVYQEYF